MRLRRLTNKLAINTLKLSKILLYFAHLVFICAHFPSLHAQSSLASPSDTHRSFVRGPGWGTSVCQTPFLLPHSKFLKLTDTLYDAPAPQPSSCKACVLLRATETEMVAARLGTSFEKELSFTFKRLTNYCYAHHQLDSELSE